MALDHKVTQRGFAYVNFKDFYGEPCSIQKSSLADVPALWLGIDHYRMHLSQEQVAELLPLLTHFVETGELPRVEGAALEENTPSENEPAELNVDELVSEAIGTAQWLKSYGKNSLIAQRDQLFWELMQRYGNDLENVARKRKVQS
jgi:hypothetical protein